MLVSYAKSEEHMQKKNLKIGMLGFGSMGKTHTYALKNLPFFYQSLPFSAELYGVCTKTPEKAEYAKNTFGYKLATTNEDELIYSDETDIIDISTPNIFHFESIMKAINAGKHIYCEKPLCVSLSEAEEIKRAAREKGVIFGMVFNNRFIPAVMRAKQLIDEGRIGRILSFSASYYHSSATDVGKAAGWKQNKDICGGGVLFDLGSHVIDLVHYLCGEISSLSAISQIAYPTRTGMDGKEWQTNAEEAFYMLCELSCGGVGTISASKVHTGANDDVVIEIYGEKGALKYSLMECEWLHFYDNTAKSYPLGGEKGFTKLECVGRYDAPGGIFPSPKAPVGWLMGHVTNYLGFLTALCEGKQPSPGVDDGAYVQRVMEAGYKSASLRRSVRVDDLSVI